MAIFAVILPMLAFIIPLFIMFILYAAIFALIIWFIITFLNNQKERNRLLAEISAQMKCDGVTPKEYERAESQQGTLTAETNTNMENNQEEES